MLSIHHLTLTSGSDILIKNGNLQIDMGEKIGLIGKNGIGKSLLLEAISQKSHWNELPEAISCTGSCNVDPRTTIALVEQEWRDPPDLTVSEFLGANRNDVPPELWEKKLSALSGGWLKMIQLLAAFNEKNDLLLLDEPTNSLDEERILQLIHLIHASASAVLLVSHDRDVLDQTVSTIYEIDACSRRMTRFSGGYSEYKMEKDRQLRSHELEFEHQRKRRKRIASSIQHLEDHARSIENETVHFYYRAQAAKIARRATHQKKRLEEELSAVPHPQWQKTVRFEVRQPHQLKTCIIRSEDLTIRHGDRIHVSGNNGSGKSTLLARLANSWPSSNPISRDRTLGYLPQILPRFHSADRIIDTLMKEACLDSREAGKVLGGLYDQDATHMRVGTLSEGELKKLSLAILLARGCHALILDEPTNHLDVYTIEALERALKTYTGALIVTSHDRRFLEHLKMTREVSCVLPASSHMSCTDSVFS